jgi:DNA invertase Pin-like site-specific DNA recombinase
MKLMASLKPKPPFDALIMSEESRLGREQIEVSYALKSLVTANVRVFLYLADAERTFNSPIEKAMLALQTMADEMEREKARMRSRDAAKQRAAHGRVAGGVLFGYLRDWQGLLRGHVRQASRCSDWSSTSSRSRRRRTATTPSRARGTIRPVLAGAIRNLASPTG